MVVVDAVAHQASTGPRHRCRGSALDVAKQHWAQRLQRGLGIAAEDRALSQRWQRCSGPASTGPRHRCRGSAAVESDLALSDELQRGLGIAAEDRT